MLKSLELFGFKSFADRTRFDFHIGVTGIVGPNGSGKSNVVDSIKWVLGDQSAKSLRGKEMTDVIFNGSRGRKASNFAQATLTFDNSRGFLPIEEQEVQIGRRIWRNGDSEYLINQVPARLRDIRNLLMGTGAGASAYCIIEQGRVDQILQTNATNRRIIFEEAAGISRYKTRKIEAERKLERVDQNLLRLTDIVDEVEAQLNSLRSQAQKAAAYREISNELRQLWLGLSADDFRFHSTSLEQVKGTIRVHTHDIEQLNQRLLECEEQLSVLENETSELDNRLQEEERQSASIREAAASHNATVQHLSTRQLEFDSELIRLRKQRSTMAAQARDVGGELKHTEEKLNRVRSDFDVQRSRLDTQDTQIKELADKIESDRQIIETNRRQLLEKMRELSDSKNHAKELETKRDSLVEEKQSSKKRLGEMETQLERQQSECKKWKTSVEQARKAVESGEQNVKRLSKQRESLLVSQEEFQRTLASQREHRSASVARKSVLEDLERRQEGMGIGVKEILSRSQTSDQPPWNRIRGTVADLLEVDLEQAALLEVALGNRAQLIVLDQWEPLLEFLNSETCQISGRVGFLSYQPDHPSTIEPIEKSRKKSTTDRDKPLSDAAHFHIDVQSLPDLREYPGVQDRADRLVSSADELPRLPEQLLADTWIVNTLDTAIKLWQETGGRCRFVTLQGELFDSDGTLTVGTLRSETALVSRKSELRRLNSAQRELAIQIDREERRLSNLDVSLADADAELNVATAESLELNERFATLNSELDGRNRELDRTRNDQESLSQEISRIEEQINRVQLELADAQMDFARSEENLQTFQSEIDQRERNALRTEHRLQTLEGKKTAEQLDLVKDEERLNGLLDAFQRIEQDQRQKLKLHDEGTRRLKIVTSKRRETTLNILNTNAVLAELRLAEEHFAAIVSVLLVEKDRFRARRSELLETQSHIRQARRDLAERQHHEEIKARDIRHEIQTLETRTEEEYQLPLRDVVASGMSAMRILLEEQHNANKTEDTSKSSSTDDDEMFAENVDPEFTSDISPPALTDGDSAHRADNHPSHNATSHADERASDHNTEPIDLAAYQKIREELEARVVRLRRKIRHMGNVNTDSLRDLNELEQRYTHLDSQLQDLLQAKTTLEEIIRKINEESKRLFTETFESVRGHFRDLFRNAFGGGDGDIILEDVDDVLDCGIDIVARPPGKELKSISLMSGGEKTLTAFALLLAMFKTRPSPYCLLDEVDASLDEANVGRLIALLEKFKDSTQFILITHKKPTMTIADVLYGITMEESGVSKRLSVRFDDVRENGEFAEQASNRPDSNPSGENETREAA